jgi:hypothetical protein
MQRLLKRGVMAILGLALTLTWWSIRGGNGKSDSVSRIPAKVWEGGAGSMTIDVETSGPARMSVTFSEEDGEGGEVRSLEAWEKIEAGSHSWTIDLPPSSGGYIDLTAEGPAVGARLSWVIRVNDQVMAEETQTLDQPLEPNYAFGLQLYMDDYSSASLE